jgi:hypothetical protein
MIEESVNIMLTETTPKKITNETEQSPREGGIIMTQKKAKQLEKERKKREAIAKLNNKLARWKRLQEPVFSGAVMPEFNTITGHNLHGVDTEIKDEYLTV